MLGDNNLSVPKEQNVLKHHFSDQKTAEPSVTGNDGSSRMEQRGTTPLCHHLRETQTGVQAAVFLSHAHQAAQHQHEHEREPDAAVVPGHQRCTDTGLD